MLQNVVRRPEAVYDEYQSIQYMTHQCDGIGIARAAPDTGSCLSRLMPCSFEIHYKMSDVAHPPCASCTSESRIRSRHRIQYYEYQQPYAVYDRQAYTPAR